MAPRRGRARRQERQENRHERVGVGDSGPTPDTRGGPERYKMTQELVSIGDDYYVENVAGKRAFKVDGKALRVRDTLKMTDLATGDEYRIRERIARVRDTMTIQKNGTNTATVHKAVVTPIRDRFTISIPGMENLSVMGNILAHEYKMMHRGKRVADVSKKWFRCETPTVSRCRPGWTLVSSSPAPSPST